MPGNIKAGRPVDLFGRIYRLNPLKFISIGGTKCTGPGQYQHFRDDITSMASEVESNLLYVTRSVSV